MSDYLKEGFIDEVKGCLGGRGSGQENVIESIKINGVGQTVDENKAVDIPVPTKISDLDNDSGYITEDQVNSKVTEGVASIVANAPEDFDTLKEMSDWISQHEDSAAAMNSSILKNKEDIEALQTSKADHDDVDAILEDIGELNSNLSQLEFGENAGGKNIYNGKIIDGLLIETGEIFGQSAGRITSDFIPVEPNTLYTQIAPTSAKKGRYCEYDANKNLVYFDQNGLQDTFTTKPTTKYLRISFGSEYGTTFKNDIAIIKGNATEYEPYIPSVKMLAEENTQQNTETMDLKMLGWTVPSECPVQNYVDSDGVFHQIVGRVDLSNLNWVNESYAPSHFYAQFTSIKNFTEIEKANIFCAKYTVVSASDASNQSLNKVIVSSNQYIAVDDNSYTDATTFKNAMQDVYLYYELATPITMTIDGNEAVTQIKNDLSEQFNNRSYSGTLPECVSSVAKAIANGQSTTFNFLRENDSYYFGFVGRFTENLIGGLMTNSSGAVYKIGGSVESPTTTQM